MDPYAYSPRVARPGLRNRDPRDPREPYTRIYTNTTPPIPEPFPSTGSLDFRQGVFNHRSMTVKEQQFEQYVNVWQAEHDVRSPIKEWERLRAIEVEAIRLWQELDGNLVEYQRQMRTRDQQETEFQCQRKKQKADDLYRLAFFSKDWEQEYLKAVARRAFMEAVVRRAVEAAARRTMEAEAATFAQKTPSEEPSTMDGISSGRGGPDTVLESSGESSSSPSPQQMGSADGVSRDLGRPSRPTQRPIYNTVRPPRRFLPRPSTRTQSSGNSSNSPSPQRSSSVDDSTPPSSLNPSPPKTPPATSPFPESTMWTPSPTEIPTASRFVPHATTWRTSNPPPSSYRLSRPPSLNPSPPETPTASRFVPDPSIWGTSNPPSSSNHPSQPPSLSPSSSNHPSQAPTLNPSPPELLTVTYPYPEYTRITKLSSLRYQRARLFPTTNVNEPTLGEQIKHSSPTDGFLHGPLRTVEEPEKRKVSRWAGSWAGVVG